MLSSQPRTAMRPHSHQEQSHRNESTMDSHRHGYSSASVKSFSSTENSRRDSAISSSSQQRHRPRTSRTMSRQSVQTVAGDDMSHSPSQPPRHRPRGRRFASAGSIHGPQTNIEETLAFHARSCEVFAGASRPSTAYGRAPASSYGNYAHPSFYRSLSSSDALPLSQHSTNRAATFDVHVETSSLDATSLEDQYYTSSFPPTVMHWTSHEARLKEYAEIDRSNTGVRGLLRKMLPKCVTKSHGKFYEEKDGSDAGSVRRIRMDYPAEKSEELLVKPRGPRYYGV